MTVAADWDAAVDWDSDDDWDGPLIVIVPTVGRIGSSGIPTSRRTDMPAADSSVLDLTYGSVEPVECSIDAGDTDGFIDDPTTAQVFLAFVARGQDAPLPDALVWQLAEWDVDRSGRVPVYKGRCIPTGIARGVTYAMYVMVRSLDVAPVRLSGFVRWS